MNEQQTNRVSGRTDGAPRVLDRLQYYSITALRRKERKSEERGEENFLLKASEYPVDKGRRYSEVRVRVR